MTQNITYNVSLMEIEQLNTNFLKASAQEVLEYFLAEHKNKIALASSLSIEDQVLTDMIYKINSNAKVFTLDTGRLPYETYDLIDQTNNKYNNLIKVLFPDNIEVERYIKERGINAFYQSVENRKLCCKIRKVNVLERALSKVDAWITGLRKEQSATRENNSIIEYDNVNGKLKINPLANWSETKVWDYINENNVPYNRLFDKGYKSIGCAPCSRAVSELEHSRNGRWWWENPETKECGLHFK